jgi:hypothetical protein
MSKNKTRKPGQVRQQTKWPVIGLIVGTAAILVLIAAALAGNPGAVGQPVMTLEPAVIANLTALPQATPLSTEEAGRWRALQAVVEACGDYSPERQSQMQQHIAWILHPADIPVNVVLALGDNPAGRLVYGMASYTSIQWRLNDRNPDSCLVPIGHTLNTLLIALGEQPFDIYPE